MENFMRSAELRGYVDSDNNIIITDSEVMNIVQAFIKAIVQFLLYLQTLLSTKK